MEVGPILNAPKWFKAGHWTASRRTIFLCESANDLEPLLHN